MASVSVQSSGTSPTGRVAIVLSVVTDGSLDYPKFRVIGLSDLLLELVERPLAIKNIAVMAVNKGNCTKRAVVRAGMIILQSLVY